MFRRDDRVQTSAASNRGGRLPGGPLRHGDIIAVRVRGDNGTVAQLQRFAHRHVRRGKLDEAADQPDGPLHEHQVRDGRSAIGQPRPGAEHISGRGKGGGDLREKLRGQFGAGGGRDGAGDRRDRAEERYSAVDREGGETGGVEENLDSVAPGWIERGR